MILDLKTVLLVDDNQDDRELFTFACEKAAITFDLKIAFGGPQAIDYLKGQGEFSDRKSFPLPHLVVMDIKMPQLSGFDVLQWVRQTERIADIPVVMLTSSAMHSDIKEAYRLCANSYLVKPMNFADLISAVKIMELYWLRMNRTLSRTVPNS